MAKRKSEPVVQLHTLPIGTHFKTPDDPGYLTRYGTLLSSSTSSCNVRWQVSEKVTIKSKEGERTFTREHQDQTIAPATMVVPITRLPKWTSKAES